MTVLLSKFHGSLTIEFGILWKTYLDDGIRGAAGGQKHKASHSPPPPQGHYDLQHKYIIKYIKIRWVNVTPIFDKYEQNNP